MREVPKKKKKFTERVSERFDSFVGIFSPRAAYHRKAFRYAQYALTSYRGAERSRIRSSWLPGGGSADEDLLPELTDLRERSRDLNRNDAHAAGITTTMVTNVVGTGIRPQSRIDRDSLGLNDKDADEFQKKAERIWQRWVPFADATERMNFYEIQQLVDRQILENGEAIILPLMLNEKYRPYKLALEVVEADRLQTPMDKRNDKKIRHGVELGERGQPVAYWVRKTHPGDSTLRLTTPKAHEFVRISAKNELGRPNLLHLYWVCRPGQTRGVPFFAPVMTLFKDLADYLEAEVIAARVAACFALFVEQNDPYASATNRATKTNSSGQRIEEMEPGMVEYLAPGEKISSFAPQRPGGSFEPFVTRMLRAFSAALGLPYELVAKDFSKTNYSSARAALLQAMRYFRCRQEWLSARLCQPTWDMVLEEAYLKNEFPALDFYLQKNNWTRARWIAPGWGWVDPTKEVKASRESVEGNISTLADEAAALGRDWEEVMEQRAREEQKRKELGLPEPKSKDTEIDPGSDEKESKQTEQEAFEKLTKLKADFEKIQSEIDKSQQRIEAILNETTRKIEETKETTRKVGIILNEGIRDFIAKEA